MNTVFQLSFILMLLVLNACPKPMRHKRCTDSNACDVYSERFDACYYPAAYVKKDEFRTAREGCYYNITFFKELRKTTADEIDIVQELLEEMNKSRCERQIRKLEKKQLDNYIPIKIKSNTDNLDKITSTYHDMVTHMHLLQLVRFRLDASMDDCCLNDKYGSSFDWNNGLLKHWFNLQNACEDTLDTANCEVEIQIDLDENVGCDKTADILYLVLKRTKTVLERSKTVLRRKIQKLRKSRNVRPA